MNVGDQFIVVNANMLFYAGTDDASQRRPNFSCHPGDIVVFLGYVKIHNCQHDVFLTPHGIGSNRNYYNQLQSLEHI